MSSAYLYMQFNHEVEVQDLENKKKCEINLQQRTHNLISSVYFEVAVPTAIIQCLCLYV